MKRLIPFLAPFAILTAAASAQSQELFSVDKPSGSNAAWGSSLISLHDLTGDGVRELLIGGVDHGGGQMASVHSGADGSHLYSLAAPFQALFYGDGFASIADRNADGIPEVVVIGSRSGDSHSFEGEIRIHSGADGSTLNVFQPPTGLNFVAHGEWSVQSMGDMDGDGSDDLLCRTHGVTTGGPTYSLFSSADGSLMYTVAQALSGTYVEGVARLADHDGDGLGDFALGRRDGLQGYLTVMSGASGQVISEFLVPELSVLTGNREPFIGLRGAPDEGARQVAFGGVFQGIMGTISTLDGQVNWSSTCDLNSDDCFGSRLVDLGDVNSDGHSDLLALQARFGGSGNLDLRVLDGRTGEKLREESMDGTSGGYSNTDRIKAMPGVDSYGFPTFARMNETGASVSMRRLLPSLGQSTCFSKRNTTGQSAMLTARGSASRTGGYFELQLDQAPPTAFAILVHGDVGIHVPFGSGVLCVGGDFSRLGFAGVDPLGQARWNVDLGSYGDAAEGWSFQVLFREIHGQGLNASSSVSIKVQP